MFIFINCFYNGICDVPLFIYNIWNLIYLKKFSCIFKKKLFSSSETKSSSDIIFSFSSSSSILFLIFLFSKNKGYIFFQKHLLSETFFWVYFIKICGPFYITNYNIFFVSYVSLKNLVFSS